MAVVINYGRVFKSKNTLISSIENGEGFKSEDDKLEYLSKISNYNGEIDACYTLGNNGTIYFSVRLFISFSLPFLQNRLNVPVTGTTSAIKIPNGGVTKITKGVAACNTTSDNVFLGTTPLQMDRMR